jgi:uracil-DNA glycosylase
MGCGHFSATNQFLAQKGKAPIDWRLPPKAELPLSPTATSFGA